jgi:hypothetical protein
MLPPYSQVSDSPYGASVPDNPQTTNSYVPLSPSFYANSLAIKKDLPKKDEKSLAKHEIKICPDCNRKIKDNSSTKHIDVCPEAIVELQVDSNISDDLTLFVPRKLSKPQGIGILGYFFTIPKKYNIFSSFDTKINYNIINFSCGKLVTDKISLVQQLECYDMKIMLNNKRNLKLYKSSIL